MSHADRYVSRATQLRRAGRLTNKKNRRHRAFKIESLEKREMLTGTWTQFTQPSPTTTNGTMELLSDGTVMMSGDDAQHWFKLTPDANGSYVNGTWSTLPNYTVPRAFCPINVLPDGRVFVLGGINLNVGEIFDPVANSWSTTAPYPEAAVGSSRTMVLPDGRVLAGSPTGPQTYIYNPTTNTWSAGPTKLDNDPTNKEVWTKLADGSILSYNVTGNPQHAQRLDTATMTWVDSGYVPVSLQSGIQNLGAGVLLPDGRVLQMGANSNTAIYTPSTTPGGTGSWIAGPVLPDGMIGGQSGEVTDNINSQFGSCCAAMLPNGRVLLIGGHATKTADPFHVFEFDPNAPIDSSLTDVTPTASHGSMGSASRMLVLPTGEVLEFLQAVPFVYTPDGAPQASWKPTVSSVIANGNHYTLTGTQLNGLSAGAYYGVGNEMDSNYPIVELKNAAGKVYFARTSNWSSTGVATGSTPVTTDFTLPAGLPLATYQLTVVANGISSDSISFTGGFTGADLSVIDSGPATSNEGDNLTFTLTVKNNGPSAATNVVLTDTLGANLSYISATKSQGSFTRTGSVVKFSFGTVAVGQTVTAMITAQATEDGNLTNSASVTSSVTDPNPQNNSAVATVAVAEPPIAVSGPIIVIGKSQSNIQVATFTHANGVEPASDFVATIHWGDGTTSTGTISQVGSTYKVKGSHTYASNGLHTVTTTVVEAQSGGGGMHSMEVVSGNTVDSSGAATGGAIGFGDTAESPPTVSSGNPTRSKSSLVDQLLAADSDLRGSRILARRSAVASEDVLDNLFADD